MNSLSSSRAVAAVVLLFCFNGLVVGVYAASIPSLYVKFGLAPWEMSIFFVVTGLAAIAAMQVSGRLADRFGARRVSLVMLPVLIVAILSLTLAPNLPLLFVAGVLLDRQTTPAESERYPNPERTRGAWIREDVTQIDDQQHALSALLLVRELEARP